MKISCKVVGDSCPWLGHLFAAIVRLLFVGPYRAFGFRERLGDAEAVANFNAEGS